MVALGSFSKEVLVFLKLLLIGERNTGNTLDRLILAVAQPVGSGVLYPLVVFSI